MPKVISIQGVVEDGTPPTGVVQLGQGKAIQAAFGENLTIHLIVRGPSGKQVVSSTQRVITFGARTKPLPTGQLLFQHNGVPTLDGGWDLSIVPADYKLIGLGAGRFFFDVWLTDNSLSPPQSNPVQALSAFIVTPSAISVT